MLPELHESHLNDWQLFYCIFDPLNAGGLSMNTQGKFGFYQKLTDLDYIHNSYALTAHATIISMGYL